MISKFRILLLILALNLSSPVRAADNNPSSEIRKLISSDCSLALSHFQGLTEDQKDQALELFFEVIRFRLTQINPSFALQTEFVKAPEGVLDHLALAQSLSPADQKVAKQCVLSILPLYPQKSQVIIPELIRISQDPTEDFSIRVRLKESAYQIAKQLTNPAFVLDQKVLEELIKIQLDTPTDFSKQILALFVEQLISEVSNKLLNLECAPESCTEFRQWFKLLSFLAEIPESYESLLPLLIKFINQPTEKLLAKQEEISTAYLILKKVFDFESEYRSFLVDPNIRLSLFSLFPSASMEQREVLEHGLIVLANYGEAFIQATLNMSKSEDIDLRIRSVRFLARANSQLKEAKAAQESLRKDSDLRVKLEAFAKFPPKLNTNKILDSLASEILLEKDLGLRHKLAVNFIETSDRFGISNPSTAFSNLIWNTAESVYKDETYIELREKFNLLLSSRQGQLRARIKSLGTSKLEAEQELALKLYRSAADNSSKISELGIVLQISGSSNSALASLAEALLLERNSINTNSKTVQKYSPKVQSEFYLSADPQNQALTQLLEMPCQTLKNYFQVCLNKDTFGPYCKGVFVQSDRCWNDLNIAYLELNNISKILSLQGQALRHKLNDFSSWPIENCNLALASARQNLLDDQLICKALTAASCSKFSKELQSIALTRQAANSEFSTSCLPDLKQAFEVNKTDYLYVATLLKTIFLLDPSSIDVSVLFKDALENQTPDLILAAAELGYTEVVISSIRDHLENQSLSINEIEFLLKTVEKLGESGKSLLPSILKYSDKTELAYQAKRTIISIAGDNQVLLANSLQSLLGSLAFPELIEDTNLNNLKQAVSLLEANPTLNLSYFERKDLNHLKCKLEEKAGLCFETL